MNLIHLEPLIYAAGNKWMEYTFSSPPQNPEVLIAVSVRLQKPAGIYWEPEHGFMWIYLVTDSRLGIDDALILTSGPLYAGVLSWQGQIPCSSPMIIRAYNHKLPVGDKMWFNLLTSTRSELRV